MNRFPSPYKEVGLHGLENTQQKKDRRKQFHMGAGGQGSRTIGHRFYRRTLGILDLDLCRDCGKARFIVGLRNCPARRKSV